MNDATGGVEEKKHNPSGLYDVSSTGNDSFSLLKSQRSHTLVPQEAQVERDPDTGYILYVVKPQGADNEKVNKQRPNPLQDPLNDIVSTEDGIEGQVEHGVVRKLEIQAAEEAEKLERTKRPRQQSKREEEWIQELIQKYGNNIMGMARDRRLNVMQQSEGDIQRRIKRWQQRHLVV